MSVPSGIVGSESALSYHGAELEQLGTNERFAEPRTMVEKVSLPSPPEPPNMFGCSGRHGLCDPASCNHVATPEPMSPSEPVHSGRKDVRHRSPSPSRAKPRFRRTSSQGLAQPQSLTCEEFLSVVETTGELTPLHAEPSGATEVKKTKFTIIAIVNFVRNNFESCNFCCVIYCNLFCLFLICFPLFLKFLTTAPMPRAYWHVTYDDFPILEDWAFVRQDLGINYTVDLSPIPTTWSGCDYSCGSPSMDFNVEAELQAPGFKHTVYPILLASTDFKEWWVAADGRHARPQEFFASNDFGTGLTHRLVTEQCSRKLNPNEDQRADPTASPTYLLVCVTWTLDKIRKLRDRIDQYGDLPDLEHHSITDHCDVVGGTCGWTCGSKGQVSKCSPKGTLEITEMFPVNDFKMGSISVRPCKTPRGDGSCITSDLPMSQWPCHECVNVTRDIDQLRARDEIRTKMFALQELKLAKLEEVAIGGPDHAIKQKEREVKQIEQKLEVLDKIMSHYAEPPEVTHVYQSLPQLEVVLQDFHPEDLVGMTSPHAFILSSTKPDGPWHQVYHDFYSYPLPIPVHVKDSQIENLAYKVDRNMMQLAQRNKLMLEPRKCFAKRGPLYIVMCAVNQSTHKDRFELEEFARVAPPPFNDRCIAVQGRCAYACMEQQSELEHCNTSSGKIHQKDLVKPLRNKKNESFLLTLYVVVLLLGFASKVLSLVPGVIWGYSPDEFLCRKDMTQQLKYIAVCTPAAGESKACVLRNLVGSISCIPHDCACPYHVAYTDEGHRHAHKEMFHVLNNIVRLLEARDQRLEAEGRQARIFRSFMQKWVECTKETQLKRLDDAKFEELGMYDDMLRKFSGESAFEYMINEASFKYKFKDFEDQFKKRGAEESNAAAAHREVPDFTTPDEFKSDLALPADAVGPCHKVDCETDAEADRFNWLLYQEIQVMKEVLKAGKAPLRSSDEVEKVFRSKPTGHAEEAIELHEARSFELLVTVDGQVEQEPRMCRVEQVKSCKELKSALREKLELSEPIKSLSCEDEHLKKQVIHDNINSMPLGKCSVQVRLGKPCQHERVGLSLRWAARRKKDVKNKKQNEDDVESYTKFSESKLCLHYLARAKPDEDDFTTKTRHVNKGVWCYEVKENDPARWLSFREETYKGVETVRERQTEGDDKYTVPLRTSRGKAGGMNFTENYLWLFHEMHEEEMAWLYDLFKVSKRSLTPDKPALFSIADARHQFQPDFFNITVPYFFKTDATIAVVNKSVAFTQCPQYFPENKDDLDYLDTNNAHFYRFSCMIRDCVGGVSSCGTNGTWLIMPRKTKSIWNFDPIDGWVEQQVFHESCKIEDTASSLHSVLEGKHSLYINMRLSVGIAKEAMDYLAAIQRWSEGAVVLSYQTFICGMACSRRCCCCRFFCGCCHGNDGRVFMLWGAMLLWASFVSSVWHFTFKDLSFLPRLGSEQPKRIIEPIVSWLLNNLVEDWEKDDYVAIVFAFENWFTMLWLVIVILWLLSAFSWLVCKHSRFWPYLWRFPTNISQWLRLFITIENLTYFLWFWTSFFWVGFNYYSVFTERNFGFEPQLMAVAAVVLNLVMWSIVIASCIRFFGREHNAFNQKWELTLTNIWRTTQLYYITAPLQAYSLLKGSQDFYSWFRYNEDISWWSGGDRGTTSRNLVKGWTTLLVLGVPFVWICIATGVAAEANNSIPAAIVCSFIGVDALHPCAFLWLGIEQEPLDPPIDMGKTLVSSVKIFCWKLCNLAWYRNKLRACIFSPCLNGLLQWSGPFQNVFLTGMSYLFPQFALTAVLNLVIGA